MARKTTVSALLLVCLCAVASAQEEGKPWLKDELDPDALKAEFDRLDPARAALVQDELGKAAELLGVGEIAEEDRARWTGAVGDRASALKELLAAAELLPEIPEPERLGNLLRAATEELGSLDTPEPLPLPEDLSESRVLQLDVILEAAEAEEVRSSERLGRLLDLQAAAPELEQERTKLAERLEAMQVAPGDELTAYERDTLVVRLRLTRMRADAAPRVTETTLELFRARREIARVRIERARDLVRRARESLIERRGAEAAGWDEKARRAKEAAKGLEGRPVEQFKKQVEAQLFTARAEEARDRQSLQELKSVVETQSQTSQRLAGAWDRLKAKFEGRRGTSRRTPRLLLANLKLAAESRSALRRKLQPQLDRFADRFLDGRADLVDWIWEIDTPLDESPPGYEELMARVPAERREAARSTYVDARATLRAALRNRLEVLEEGVVAVEKLDGLYLKRRELLDDMEAFVVTKIYWVRGDEPLGLGTVGGVVDEIEQLVDLASSPRIRRSFRKAYEEDPWTIFLVAITLLLLLGVEVRLWKGLRRPVADRAAEPAASPLRQVGRALLRSALVPLFLVIACSLLSLVEFPEVVTVVYRTVFYGLAAALLVRRLSTALFGEGGIAVQSLGGSPEAAHQLHRFLRWASLIIVFAGIPLWICSAETFELTHLPHVLQTFTYACSGAAIIYLFRRKGPFVQTMTSRSGVWRRAFVVVSPLLALSLVGIVVMTVLGYRYGAYLIFGNVCKTLVSGLLLAAVYRLLTRLAERAASRLRYFRLEGERSAESRRRAEKHLEQFTKLVGAMVVIVGVVLLAQFWGVTSSIGQILGSARIATVDAATDTHLTLLDVLEALAWVAFAHYLARRLPGLLDVLVFSRLGTVEVGTRYVVVAVSKYAILLIAYSAALLTLHFSFSSVGWLLAAASVGLGFGLQEIVSNFVSGLILFIERPIRVGDMVSVGATLGTVERIDIRATKILNLDRQVIIIPNRKFISEDVVNWTHNDLLVRSSIDVGVAYGSDVAKVRAILEEVAVADRRVKREPAPRILFTDFGESSLNFRIFFHTEIQDRIDTTSDLRYEIDRRFAEEGVTIPFPQRDLHVKTPAGADLLDAFRGAPPRPDDLSGPGDSGSAETN